MGNENIYYTETAKSENFYAKILLFLIVKALKCKHRVRKTKEHIMLFSKKKKKWQLS